MSDQQFKKHPDVPVEPYVMPSGKLFVWVGAMCAVVIVVTIMVWQEFNHATTREMQKKQLASIEPALAKAAQADKRAAAGYGVVSKKKNLYRIPIRMAQDMLMRTPTLLLPADIPDDKPAPTKAPAKPVNGYWI